MALSWAASRASWRAETTADRKADALAALRVVTWVCSSGLQYDVSSLHLSPNPMKKKRENDLICVRSNHERNKFDTLTCGSAGALVGALVDVWVDDWADL